MDDCFGVSLNTLLEREKFLTTGCANLDRALKGGMSCNGITQIYGAAGTGKTQLALQLCLTVQLPVSLGGLAAGAVYVCTEACFPSRRLQELIQKFDKARENNINGDQIFVEHASTMDKLESCLSQKIPLLMNVRKIGLIVIDSVAAPYRVENWNDKSTNRGGSLRNVGYQLHKLCKNGDVCIICINQVTAVTNICTHIHESAEDHPALGITWSSMVTNSIYFYRRNTERYACVMASSYIPRITIPFEVRGCGVMGKE